MVSQSRKKLSVIGPRGFLGTYLCEVFEELDYEISKLSFGDNTETINGHYVWKDFPSLQDHLSAIKPDLIVNCAAITDISLCDQDFGLAMQVNAKLPAQLLEIANLSKAFLVHISSDAVYCKGISDTSPSNANSIINPNNGYAKSKLAGDNNLMSHGYKNFCIIRTSFYGHSKSGRPSFFDFCLESFEKGITVNGYRDYIASSIHVETLAQAINQVISRSIKGLVLLGTKTPYSKFEFALEVAQQFGYSPSLVNPSLSPSGFHSSGGANCSLESSDYWDELGIIQPSLNSDIILARIMTEKLSG
jgi:dTDP-4-dehydrorhamnose reductase